MAYTEKILTLRRQDAKQTPEVQRVIALSSFAPVREIHSSPPLSIAIFVPRAKNPAVFLPAHPVSSPRLVAKNRIWNSARDLLQKSNSHQLSARSQNEDALCLPRGPCVSAPNALADSGLR